MALTTRVPATIDVPGDAFGGDEPLVAVNRGGFVGSLHRGQLAVSDTAGEISVRIGRVSQPVFLRSAAKPFQVMPAVLSGGIERFGLTQQELAILCASHSAEQRHIDTVLSVLDKIGLPEDALRCGIHPPIHEPTAAARLLAGLEPSPVCNNCSGAHTGMLVACRAMGWSIDDYGDPAHPLQVMTREILGAFTDLAPDDIEYGVDNCAVPTFHIPLDRAARAFARLATGRDVPGNLSEVAGRVRAAMTAHPEMIGGEDSFDTDLMSAAGGTIVAKSGAEGFQGIGLREAGLGVAIKISDGNERAIPPVAVAVLHSLNALPDGPLDRYREPETANMLGEPVGRVQTVFRLEATA